jgi:hypothetical protein
MYETPTVAGAIEGVVMVSCAAAVSASPIHNPVSSNPRRIRPRREAVVMASCAAAVSPRPIHNPVSSNRRPICPVTETEAKLDFAVETLARMKISRQNF